eukprot:XP_001691104.1 predicted protein [Chlamydomonas reinhardtii]
MTASHDTHRDLLAETMARMAKHNDRLKWESQRLQGDVRDKAAKTIQVWWRLYYHRLKEQRKIEKRLKSTWMQSVRRMTLPPAPPERPEFEDDDGNARGDGEGDGGKKKGKKDKGKAGEHADDEAERVGADGKKKKSKSKKGKGSKSGEMGADGANGDEGGEGADGTNGIGAEGDSGADGKKKRKAKKAKRSGGAEGNEEHVSEEDGGKKKKKGKKRKQAGDGGDGHGDARNIASTLRVVDPLTGAVLSGAAPIAGGASAGGYEPRTRTSYLARSPRGQPSSGGVYGPSADGGGDGGRLADAAAAVQLQSGTSRSFGDDSSRRVLQLVGEAGGASGEVRTPLRKAITFHVAGLLPEDAGTEGAGHADGSADSGAAAAVVAREAMAHDTSQLPRSAAAVAGAGSGLGVSAFAPAASLPAVGSLDASAGATSPAAGGAADAFPEPALLVPRPASTSAPQLTFADDDLELPSHSGRAGVAAAVGNAAAAAGEQGSSLSLARSRRDSPPRGSSTRTAPCSPQREPSAAALSAAMQIEATAGSLTTTGVAPSAAAANATVGSPYASPFTSYGFGAPSQPGGDVVSVLRVTSLGAKSGLVLPSQSARGNASPLRRQGQSLHSSLASPLLGTGGSPARSQPGQRAALAAEASASCTSGALRRGEAVAGGPHLDREAGLNGQRAETAAPSEQGGTVAVSTAMAGKSWRSGADALRSVFTTAQVDPDVLIQRAMTPPRGVRGVPHAVAGMGEVQGVAGDGGQLAEGGSAAPPRKPPDHVQAGAAVLLPPGSASTPGTAVSIGDGMALGVMRQPEPTSSGLSFMEVAGGVEAGQDAADLVASAAQGLASVAEAARDPADGFMALQPVGARVQPLLPRLDSGRGSPYTDANAAAAAAGAGGGGGSRPASAGLSLPALTQGASGAAGGAVSGESSTVSSPVRVSQLQLPGRVQPLFPAPQHAEGASEALPAHAAGTAPLSRHPPGWAAGPATAEVDSASLSAPPQLLSKAVSYGYGLRQQQQQGGGSPLPGLPAASPSGRSRLTSARLAPLATGVGGSPSASPSPSPSGAAAAAQRQGRPPHRLPAPHHHPDDAAHGLVKRSHTQALSTSAEHEEVDGAAEGGFASAPGSPAAYSAAARSHATLGAHLASPTYWSSAQTHHSHHGTGQHGHQHQAAAAAATSETDSPSQQHQPRRTADLGHSSGPPSPRHHHHPHGYQYTGGHGAADHHFHAQPPGAGAGACEALADQSLLLQEDPTSPPMHRRGPPDPGQEPASMQAASPTKPLLLHQLPYPHPQGQEQQLPRRSFERSLPPAAAALQQSLADRYGPISTSGVGGPGLGLGAPELSTASLPAAAFHTSMTASCDGVLRDRVAPSKIRTYSPGPFMMTSGSPPGLPSPVGGAGGAGAGAGGGPGGPLSAEPSRLAASASAALLGMEASGYSTVSSLGLGATVPLPPGAGSKAALKEWRALEKWWAAKGLDGAVVQFNKQAVPHKRSAYL